MRQAQEPKHRRGTGTKGHIFIGVMFTLVAVGLWFYINRENIQEYTETFKNREAEIIEIADLKQRISQLKRKQQSLTFNGVESEKQIRERLQMHKPGEKVIFIVDDAEKLSTGTTASLLTPGSTQHGSLPAGSSVDAPERSGSQKIQSVYDAM